MRTLKEDNKLMQDFYTNLHVYPKPNGILCDQCGKELFDLDNLVLTSSPPKKRVKCCGCGFEGYRYV